MAIDKKTLPSQYSPKSVASLIGTKLISAASAYRVGSTYVIELTFSDSTTGFIKAGPNGSLELGGDNQFGTGTQVIW
jgi:hypothetical protein